MKKQFAPIKRTIAQPIRAIAWSVTGLALLPIGWTFLPPASLAAHALQSGIAAFCIPLALFVLFYFSWDITDRIFHHFVEPEKRPDAAWQVLLHEPLARCVAGVTAVTMVAPFFLWSTETTPVMYTLLFSVISAAIVAHGMLAIPHSWRTLQKRLGR